MPPVNEIEKSLSTISQSVEDIGTKVKSTDEKIVSFGNDMATLKAFEKNATEALEALRTELKNVHVQIFDASGNYRGFLPSKKHAEMIGHWFVAATLGLNPDRCKASMEYCQKANLDTTAAATAIPAPISTTIIDLVQGRYGTFRQNCRIWPNDPATVPTITGDASWSVPGEGTAPAESAPTLSNLSVTYKMFSGLVYITREADADSIIALGELVARSFARSLAKTEDTIGYNGTGGAGTPYYGYTGAFYGLGAAGKVETAGAALVDLCVDDVLKLIGVLPEDFDESAAFYGHRTIWALCMGMKDSAGRQIALFDPVNRQRTLFGYPFITSSVLVKATDVTAGTEFLRFGSLYDAATIAEKQAFKIEASDHYKFPNMIRTLLASQRKSFTTYNKGTATEPGAIVSLALGS